MSQDISQIEELTISQIHEKYKKKWIALIVTKRDTSLQPTAGKVVVHENDRYRLRQQISQFKDICIFFAGDPQYPICL